MIYKQIIGKELYVWMNGNLLYKKWLDWGHGIIFQDSPLGKAQGSYKPHTDTFQHISNKTKDNGE